MQREVKNSETLLTPGVSVVICSHDSAEVIVPTVEALALQELPEGLPYEVILVDNNCTDDTVELVRRHWNSSVGELRVIEETRPGIIHARRRGVLEARHDIIVFADDDNILARDWIRRAVAIFAAKPRAGAVGGYNEPLVDGEKPEWFERYQAVYACGTQAPRSGPVTRTRKMLFGAGLAIRTHVVRSILTEGPPLVLVGRTGKQLLRGDDSEICMRCVLKGWELWYESSLCLKHHLLPRRVTWDYIRQARQRGAAAQLILGVYQRIIDGRPPRYFLRTLRDLLRAWKKYWSKKPGKRAPGTQADFEYCSLVGRTRGLLRLGWRYNTIQRMLIEAFAGEPGAAPQMPRHAPPPGGGERAERHLRPSRRHRRRGRRPGPGTA
ncbi:MAG: glycosyltransferase [Planctomycetota bacterium]